MAYLREQDIKFSDSYSIDAFGRARFSSPYTLFDSKMVNTSLIYIWDDQEVSGGSTSSSYNTNQASVSLGVGATTAGRRTRQTRRHFNYQPGKSQLILLTGVVGSAATGITRRLGYFNDNNGLFFEQTSSGMAVVRRTYTSGSVVNNSVAQASWNIDVMDGTGVSGINIDYTKTQIFIIDFEWLGVGRVRFGFVVDGKIYYCHEINNANSLTLVYMSTPNLPLRYEIVNDGTGAASTLTQICSTVISEGGEQDTGYPYGISRGSTVFTTNNNTSIYPLMAVRLRSGYEGTTIRIIDLSIVCTSSSAYNFYLMLNPLVTGTALSYTTASDSAIEYDASTTNATTVSGAEVNLFIGTASQGNQGGGVAFQLNTDFALGSLIDGTKDVLVLGVQRLTGTNESFYASMNWKELK